MVTSRALERKVRSKSPPRLRPWAFSDGPRGRRREQQPPQYAELQREALCLRDRGRQARFNLPRPSTAERLANVGGVQGCSLVSDAHVPAAEVVASATRTSAGLQPLSGRGPS